MFTVVRTIKRLEDSFKLIDKYFGSWKIEVNDNNTLFIILPCNMSLKLILTKQFFQLKY